MVPKLRRGHEQAVSTEKSLHQNQSSAKHYFGVGKGLFYYICHFMRKTKKKQSRTLFERQFFILNFENAYVSVFPFIPVTVLERISLWKLESCFLFSCPWFPEITLFIFVSCAELLYALFCASGATVCLHMIDVKKRCFFTLLLMFLGRNTMSEDSVMYI